MSESVVPSVRIPAEWEPHAATLLAWPHQRQDWPGKFGPIPWIFVEIIRLIAEVEPVWLYFRKRSERNRISDCLDRAGVRMENLVWIKRETDRCWLRDSGPMIVEMDGQAKLLDWKFNAWAKYPNFRHDNKVPRVVSERLGLERIKPTHLIEAEARRIVLEGGAIDHNGQGILLTTEECLLSSVQERNPGLDREGYEEVFRKYLGIHQTIWLGRGILGDDTHGHIDDLARFVGNRTILCVDERLPEDPNYEVCQENLTRLDQARDADGNPFEVVRLPMPRPVVFEGQRLPASYANFYLCNGRVLVPTFHDPADREALRILEACFPDREVIGVHAVDLVWGLGTLHCLTRDIPAIAYANKLKFVDPNPLLGPESDQLD